MAGTLRAGLEGAIEWPTKRELLGLPVSATTYDELLERILDAARRGQPAIVDHLSVHGVVETLRDPSFRTCLLGFDVLAPDGQPVRWALDRLWDTRLPDRVYGPELMNRLCRGAARSDIGIFLYGGTAALLWRLAERLEQAHPSLRIVGAEAPPFRPLTPAEDEAVVDRIRRSGAGLVFIGLGCPKQERFAREHRDAIPAVQLCVGAAFDFLAGTKPMAPRWMQDRGLEWLFRLLSEPRRLWRRYLVANSIFVLKLVPELARRRRSRSAGGDAPSLDWS